MKKTNETTQVEIIVDPEVDLNAARDNLKSQKKAVTLNTALAIIEAVGSATIASFCTAVAIESLKTKDMGTGGKVFGVGLAMVSGGLCAGRIRNACKYQIFNTDVYKATNELLDSLDDAVNNSKSVDNDSTKDESTDSAICEVCNPVSNLNTTLNCIDENNEEIAKKQEENSAALDTLLDELNEHKDGKDDEVVDMIGSAITTAVENGDVDLEVKEDNIYLKKNTAKVSKSSPLLRFKRK